MSLAPVVVNMDELALATDMELIQHVNDLYTNLGVTNARDAKAYEIELAYSQREIQIRRGRYEAHAAYQASFRDRADHTVSDDQ